MSALVDELLKRAEARALASKPFPPETFIEWKAAAELTTLQSSLEAVKAERDDIAEIHGQLVEIAGAELKRLEAAEARVEELQKALENQQQAARYILPYLRWTISDESPGYHPTMPSAVAAFQVAFDLDTAEKRHAAKLIDALRRTEEGKP
jgi:hypothetical protein